MNKLIIGAISVILMLSVPAMAFDVTIHKAVPLATVDAGGGILPIPPGGTVIYSLHFQNMVNLSNGSLFKITNFTIYGINGNTKVATIALNYSPPGPVLPGSPWGFLRNGTDGDFGFEGGYVSPDVFRVTIPSDAPNNSKWFFEIDFSSQNESDTASASRTVAAFIAPKNISGTKFNDLDDDGLDQEAGEPGLRSWTINLLDGNGTFITSQVTDINGNYEFKNVPVGNYSVQEVHDHPGWTQTYPANGTWNITLSANDVTGIDFGNFNPPPTANFTFSAANCTKQVTFNASSSFSAPGKTITNYDWAFGDGNVANYTTNASFIHTYAVGGDYLVTLTVTDNTGQTNSTSKLVHVNEPPTVTLSANKSSPLAIGGEWVKFTASANDPDGDTLTYQWDNGTGSFNTSANQPDNIVLFVGSATTVRVKVDDGYGCPAIASVTMTVRQPCVPGPAPSQSLRIYGEEDIGPGTVIGDINPISEFLPNIYANDTDAFNPGMIPKDSITFNPAIILWDPTKFPMSANGQDIAVKKFLRIWYEPNHSYNGQLYNPTYHHTLEVESTYMLVTNDTPMLPTTGEEGATTFAFPIAETPGQIGLGSFDGGDGKPVVNLSEVNGSGTAGTIAIDHLFLLNKNQQVQFLDHKLKLLDLRVDPENNSRVFAKVEITYAGNLDDDTAKDVELGDLQNDPLATTYFDRHNNPFEGPSHPTTTWYARLVGYDLSATTAQIVIGKEISAGDAFYVNSERYDVPAVYVPETGEFKYITLRSPLPKGTDLPLEASVVTSQWISEIPPNTQIPLDPPFNSNTGYNMVDDINVDLWSTPGLQVSPFPGDQNTDVSDRIVPVCGPTNTSYRSESFEPRYHTILEEILNETQLGGESWDFMHVQTKPDNYTEFVLPTRPELDPHFMGDYLVTLSFIAPNSLGQIDHIYDPNGMPRAAFVFDSELNTTYDPMGINAKDIYINGNTGNATVRIYGEDDIGPGTSKFYTPNPVQPGLGPNIYVEPDEPFDPAEIPKDSITFNPAIIQWDAMNFTMSANSHNIDLKKFLRMWYEPSHTYNGIKNNPTIHPTIEVESTYMLIDSKHKLPISGSAGMTTFAFPIANGTSQIGLGSFDANIPQDGKPDLVDLASVSGSGTDGTIRIQHTFNMAKGDTVQFLDHTLQLLDIFQNSTDNLWHAKVAVQYAGNNFNFPDSPVTVDLGTTGDARAISFFDRQDNMFAAPSHPDTTWYAKLEFYSYGCSQDPQFNCTAQITVGKEISAGDTFYVKSERYDVPAVFVVYNTNNQDYEFKYITLRSPLPKGSDTVSEQSVVSSQWITEVPVNSPLPVDPPFNQVHNIVDDIDTPHTDNPVAPLLSVAQRIIGPYPALDVRYVSETIEPRYRTNLLEILNETFVGATAPEFSESWWYYNITTLPINYTEFKLQPDLARMGQPLHNDYLITLSWIAPNSQLPQWQHDILNEDDHNPLPYNRRVAFVFDANDSTGLYVNELVPPLPGTPPQQPTVVLHANASVQALQDVVADPTGTSSPNSNFLTLDFSWGDGTPDTITTTVAPVTHQYNKHGNYNVTLTVNDGVSTNGAFAIVDVTNDGVKISIKQGWNQISIPVTPSGTCPGPACIGSILGGVPGYVQTWAWNPVTLSYASVGGFPPAAGQGYFVYATGAADVIVRGTGNSILTFGDLTIVPGVWNNIGPGMDAIPLPTGIAYHWDPSIPVPGYDITTNLVPGQGYWIQG